MTSITSASKKSKAKPAKTKSQKTNKVPVIICGCGKQLLLVPDAKAMSTAIEEHIKSHKAQDKTLSEKDLEDIQDELISQIFEKIAI